MSTQLEAQGVKLIEGFGAGQISLEPDVFVIGNVVTRGNALMEEILNRGLPYISGPQWLAENVLRGRRILAVAGTHGKTTTTAMLAWMLEHAGLEPGFLIGGVPENFGISARIGSEPFFVIEADEYDTAFFDKRSKFVHYSPRTAILNNLEFDHADIFPDLAAIETQFHHLVRTVPANGLIVTNGADANLERVLARGCWTPVERFAAAGGWHAGPQSGDGRFTVSFNGEPQGEVQWDLLGVHNQQNALAAIAAARHAGVAPAVAIEALAAFENVKRRLELRGTVKGVTVYDDFAHHPTAIRTTLAGLRGKVAHLSQPATHTRGARAALEHHEARRDERRARGQPCGRRPRVLLQRRAGLGPGRGTGAARHESRNPRRHSAARCRDRRRGETRRSRADHEQWRLRRHTRQAAGTPGRSAWPITFVIWH